jgi:hypothetical protein
VGAVARKREPDPKVVERALRKGEKMEAVSQAAAELHVAEERAPRSRGAGQG